MTSRLTADVFPDEMLATVLPDVQEAFRLRTLVAVEKAVETWYLWEWLDAKPYRLPDDHDQKKFERLVCETCLGAKSDVTMA